VNRTKRSRAEGAEEACEKGCALVCPGLLVNVLQVIFDGELADAAAGGDFLVGEAAEDKSCDAGFSRGKRVGMEAPSENRLQQGGKGTRSGTRRHLSTSRG